MKTCSKNSSRRPRARATLRRRTLNEQERSEKVATAKVVMPQTLPTLGREYVENSDLRKQARVIHEVCGRNPRICAESGCNYCSEAGFPQPQ